MKKKLDKLKENFWITVAMVGIFSMTGGENLIVLLISLSMMGIAFYALRDIELDEE